MGQAALAAAELGLPLLPPVGPQAPRYDCGRDANHPQVWVGEEVTEAGDQRHVASHAPDVFGSRTRASCVRSSSR